MVDFTGPLEALVEDIVRRLPALAHVRSDTLLVTVSRARRGGLSGTYARIFPLRFEQGALRSTRRVGRELHTYEMPPLVHHGRPILYIVTFLLPRFQNLTFEQKVATVVHELYHVSERCDGDIRRLAGKNFAHGHSRQAYDRKMDALAAEYLAHPGHRGVTEFLRPRFHALEARHGGVTGRRLSPPVPRLVGREPAPRRGRPPVALVPPPVRTPMQMPFPFSSPPLARRP
ncbi:MAG TPA: putative metallopeptidase [Methylomirabilota bacterium]|nr:putative metallopeptidase [Methylomirabilota bacterium]